MKVYLIHLKSQADRRAHVLDLLFQCKLIDDLEIIMCEQSNLQFATSDEVKKTLPADFPQIGITPGNRSLFHKQLLAFKRIATEQQPAMILEDDVCFDPGMLDLFISGFSLIPDDWDMCFFGSGCQLALPGAGFLKNEGRLKTRCTDSMVVHPRIAQIISNQWESDKVYAAIDWDLNYRLMNANVYWFEPGVTVQGSQNGRYPSLC